MHGSWRRAALLALVRSETAAAALTSASEPLLASQARLLREDATRQMEPTLLAAGHPLRDQVDQLLPGMVRVGVAAATRLERALQLDAGRTS